MGARVWAALIAIAVAAGLIGETASAQMPPWRDNLYGPSMTFGPAQTDLRQLLDAVGTPAGLLGANVGEIQLKVTVAPQSGGGAIMHLSGHDSTLMLFPGEGGSGFLLMNGSTELEIGAGTAARGQAAELLLRREAVPAGAAVPGEQWVIYLDGTRAAALPAGEAVPRDDEIMGLSLGTPTDASKPDAGFAGTIDRFAVRTPQKLLYAHVGADRASLVRRTLPELGAYVEVGGDTAERQATIPGLDPADHGVFEKTVYYGVSAAPVVAPGSRGVAITVDWGGNYLLQPDLDRPDRYQPVRADHAWAGDITIEAADPATGRRARFTVGDSRTSGAWPFLRAGKRYERAPGRPAGRALTASTFDSTTGIPNFYYSVMACYDVNAMDLVNLQERGCAERPIFAFDQTSRDQGVLKNVPVGWRYIPFSTQKSIGTSSLVQSSRELSGSLSGGSGMGFTVLGFSHKSNRKAAQEFEDVAESESVLKLDQVFETESRLVLVPDEVTLDACFVHSVLRAAATAQLRGRRYADLLPEERPAPPPYYDAFAAEQTCRDGAFDDPLTPAQLVDAYGTHYAHATTYGARGLTRTRIRKNIVHRMISSQSEIASETGFETTLSKFGISEKIGLQTSDERGSGRGTGTGSRTEDVSSVTECYGGVGGCSGSDIAIGNEPAPVYLDLRRFDQLMAPPFFTDHTILTVLRPLVANEIESRLRADPPDTMANALRIIDVTLASHGCTYFNQRSDGSPPQIWGFLSDVCSQYLGNAVLGALTRFPDGTEMPQPLVGLTSTEAPEAPAPGPAPGAPYWAHMPTLEWMTGCSGPEDFLIGAKPRQGCTPRRHRIVLEPRLDGSVAGGVLALKLFPPSSAGYPVTPTYTCGDACATRFDYLTEIEFGHERSYVTFDYNLDSAFNRKLVPQALAMPLGQPAPPQLGGPMARYRDGTTDLLTFSAAFALEEQSVAGALGFKASFDLAERVPPPDVRAVAPDVRAVAPAYYRLVFQNRGAYIARYRIAYSEYVPGRGGFEFEVPREQGSGNIIVGRNFVVLVPSTATNVRVIGEAVAGGQIFNTRLGSIDRDVCVRTTGTVFWPNAQNC